MMQTSRESSDRNGSESSTSSRYRLRFPPSRFIEARLSATLERLGASLARPSHSESDSSVRGQLRGHYSGRIDGSTTPASSDDGLSVGMDWSDSRDGRSAVSGSSDGDGVGVGSPMPGSSSGSDDVAREAALSSSSMPTPASSAGSTNTESEFDDTADNVINALLQRSEVQDLARWIERVLPFSLLVLLVFISQHFKGTRHSCYPWGVSNPTKTFTRSLSNFTPALVFAWDLTDLFGPIWIAGVMVKSNDVLRAQTALETLTVVEYLLLLYRFLLPTPVWYRFFLNKDHGIRFSYLTAGLYLVFKLTSASEKVCSPALSSILFSLFVGKSSPAIGFVSGRTCPICRAQIRRPAALRSYADGSTSLTYQLF
ncbi:hypothetical protein BHE74_00000476 [Ensete ventricosum]|nr:hypothetical protein BHE74_00000476 [Ensete ventricosum]